jgi:NAD(P)H dehydrogenase (quinone)
MKSIIIYYSYSGNTKKVADVLCAYLNQHGEVEVIELKAADESDRFIAQASRGFRHIRAQLQLTNFDLNKYDLICLGTPVWAFGPAPAINAYLDKCGGIENKEVALFTTYGSGTGNERCLNYMQAILAKKGAKGFKRFSIQQFKAGDSSFVLNSIKEALSPL